MNVLIAYITFVLAILLFLQGTLKLSIVFGSALCQIACTSLGSLSVGCLRRLLPELSLSLLEHVTFKPDCWAARFNLA